MIPKQLDKLKFCRVQRNTKKPFEKEWTTKPYDYKKINFFFPAENYGVQCGYENLAVIDCDKEELALAVDQLLPETFQVTTGSGGKHFYFIIPDLKQKVILDAGGEHLGEVQSYGTQVVGPGSIHPNGKPYKVSNDKPLATISTEELYSIIKPFIKHTHESEMLKVLEVKMDSEIDNLSVESIFGTSGLKKRGSEYFGEHPVHGSDGGCNFWINPTRNMWHCFRCNSGGGPLSAIGVKEGIIDCSDAQRGTLRGAKALECIKIAKDKYGLKETVTEKIEIKDPTPAMDEVEILWDTELAEWEVGEQEWIIDKLLPSRSIAILTGKRGTLKTFITLLMSYSIASGTKFLGKFETQKGKVIYLDKENGIPIMKTRTGMIKKGLNMDEKLDVGFICFSQLKIDKLGDIITLERFLEKHQPKLLVIDTYRRGISFDENDAGAVSKLFVDTLRPMVEQFGCSIILIHHNRKGFGDSPDEMDEIRGSSDLANYADIIFKMERPKQSGGTLILKQLKNRNAPEEKPIQIKSEFEETKVVLTYEGEYEKHNQVDKCVEALMLWITEHKIQQFKTADAKVIAFRKGFKETNFKRGMNMLMDTGVIVNIGFGLYQVK